MARSGDTTRPQSVKAEFDPKFSATPHGGAALVERAMRRLGVRRILAEHLPARSAQARYESAEAAGALIAGVLLGGRGLCAAELLRDDALAAEIFGLASGVPEEATMYRVLCELAGLDQRRREAAYDKAGAIEPRLDIGGQVKPAPGLRRIVPSEPEAIRPERRAALRAAEHAVARRCHQSLLHTQTKLAGYTVVFGDGTDLEVQGRCLDAARVGREGEKHLRWMTLMLGALMIGEELMPGNADEAAELVELVRQSAALIEQLAGQRVLALLDSAFLEKSVLDVMAERRWKFIIGANQWRNILTRLAEEQPAELTWKQTGPDAARGWTQSEVGLFIHQAESWASPVTIAARRWRIEGELPGAPWHYAFIATNLEKADLPASLLKSHGYAGSLWALYSTKQGREEHYKTALADLGLHHPPSGRMGVSQTFYALGAMAYNLAMVLRYRVVPNEDGAMRLWRMRQHYFALAGYLVRTGRRLIVRLAGASVHARRQVLWERAWARAGAL